MDNLQQNRKFGQPKEIDLVDLFVVLYRKRVTTATVSLLAFILAAGYWFIQPEQLRLTAVVSTGSIAMAESAVVPVVHPSESDRLLNAIFIPNGIDKHRVEMNNTFEPPNIQILKNTDKNKAGSSVIVLTCEIKKKQARFAQEVMNSAIEDLVHSHGTRYERYVQSMNDLIEAKTLQIQVIAEGGEDNTSGSNSAEARHNIEAAILKLQSWLAASFPSKIVRPASLVPQASQNNAKLLAIGVVGSLFLGCLVAFFFDMLERAKARDSEAQSE